MSAGHRQPGKPSVSEERELIEALKNPEVRRELDRPVKVNADYDIPYLGGYSKDGETIYRDRHAPLSVAVDGTRIFLSRTIFSRRGHEGIEKALIDALGYRYGHAHALATAAEHRLVRGMGADPKHYEAALRPYIKADEHERIQKVPPDLDLTPYRDSKDERLLEAIRRAQSLPPIKSGGVSRGTNTEQASGPYGAAEAKALGKPKLAADTYDGKPALSPIASKFDGSGDIEFFRPYDYSARWWKDADEFWFGEAAPFKLEKGEPEAMAGAKEPPLYEYFAYAVGP